MPSKKERKAKAVAAKAKAAAAASLAATAAKETARGSKRRRRPAASALSPSKRHNQTERVEIISLSSGSDDDDEVFFTIAHASEHGRVLQMTADDWDDEERPDDSIAVRLREICLKGVGDKGDYTDNRLYLFRYGRKSGPTCLLDAFADGADEELFEILSDVCNEKKDNGVTVAIAVAGSAAMLARQQDRGDSDSEDGGGLWGDDQAGGATTASQAVPASRWQPPRARPSMMMAKWTPTPHASWRSTAA